MQQDSKRSTGRRRFLKSAATAGAGAATVALMPGHALAEPAAPTPAEKPAEGYRKTRHVADYYASARL
jgi:nitrous oxide reductase